MSTRVGLRSHVMSTSGLEVSLSEPVQHVPCHRLPFTSFLTYLQVLSIESLGLQTLHPN